MKILISNDDGVQAPGLKILAEVLSEIAEIIIVAPDRNRSGASNSLTLDRPIRAHAIANDVYSIEGTPTDCVHLALTGLLHEMPDMVISGINAGANLGDDIFYSGTVAAAMEGRFLGFPAIAISLASFNLTFDHYQTAARVAKDLVQQLKKDSLPAKTILSVNVPDLPFEELRSYEVTRLGTRHCAEPTIKMQDPRGHVVYWVGPPGTEEDAGPGTDFYAINHKQVSITPVLLDLTHYAGFNQISKWIKHLPSSNAKKS
ncbi:MAG: hypothetical protein ACD_44C00315G0006 [uncultured bacterium]|nr:MAG: hypothetical protein ACD_44C00315G0006 [uncultured bacterium]OGT16762.1 MAG: 5'/3'-nucleotidase SurE [Gammaproteobacteria bacterium RIFCSPHIGHO2_02_FULL_38_33]OGT23606.1 MAG: 5'/3'-nucleotidase SurE [Gammaproteobacteria bacterium RIFCSPHIGHO2_12_38_15]OGT68134.1 MAG: 5'/3'-nucleotidase SurE [Gammaproteobacteria bacterium RIFCSPLOWO2_02_FULL_38_11]OGT77827.1 MAG: 5'/3'-nucleotidase SurE [Gammaproteobacteria bacterium RIFCSPLOWO2_12_FULL_38_14]